MDEYHGDIARAGIFDQVDRRGDGAAGADLLVDQDAIASFHVADQGQRFGGRGVGQAPLLDKSQRQVQARSVIARFLGETQVGGDDHGFVHFLDHAFQVADNHVESAQHIAGDREKALDLVGVQVEGHVAVRAGHFDHISHQARRDRHARLVFLVRAGVAQVWHHGRDARGGIQAQGLDHDKQFHQVAVNGNGSGLDDVAILPAHAGGQLDENIIVGVGDDFPVAQGQFQMIRNALGKFRAGRTGIQTDAAVHQWA